jgi:6-pyruvoyltetrahydropterin/6-carboxytetrahydropterin synthase
MGDFSIRVEKENFTFAAAHFLLFHDGACERVHGHNYRAWIELSGTLEQNDYVLDFLAVKPIMKAICDRLDHRVLLPKDNPHLKIDEVEGSIEARYRDFRYCFPAADVVLLPIHNTSAELLAQYICKTFKGEVNRRFRTAHLAVIRVGVEESFGQAAIYEERFPDPA